MSSSKLKVIAMISMLIDHIAAVLGPMSINYVVMRCIGRIAMPLFCYMIAEGCRHTRNPWKYFGRLAAFALISQLPFSYAFGVRTPNVYVNLAFAVLAVTCIELFKSKRIPIFFGLLVALILAIFAEHIGADYGFVVVPLIVLLYFTQNKRMQIIVIGFGAIILNIGSGFAPYVLSGTGACVFVGLYNGKLGNLPRWFSYWFYPVHLIVLGYVFGQATFF